VAWADCPSPYDTATCDGICFERTSSATDDTWTCDLSASTSDSEASMVSDYDLGVPYEAWGIYYTGRGTPTMHRFCCESPDSDYSFLEIVGSDYGDALRFEWATNTYNLTPAGLQPPSAYIFGGNGNDVIRGSDHNVFRFYEHLYGEVGHDQIFANDGWQDYLYGGVGDDVLHGGDGPDYMECGDGDDIASGGPGADEMLGGNGDDRMAGNDDDDEMNGGAGRDAQCGDAGNDEIDDGDSVNDPETIWGDNSGDNAYCGTNGTQVGPNTGDPFMSCSTTLLSSTRPAACP
jgi:Ca2+-binding RTX toxin-like protein